MNKLIVLGDSHLVMSTSYYMMIGLSEIFPNYELFAVTGSTWLDWYNNQLSDLNINWQYKNESAQKTQFGNCPWLGLQNIKLNSDLVIVFEFGSNEMIALGQLNVGERKQYLNHYQTSVEDFLQQQHFKKVIWILPIQVRDEMISLQLQNEFRQLIFEFVKRHDQFEVIDSWQCLDQNQNPILANHQDQLHVSRPLSEHWGQFLAKKLQALFI